MKKEENEEEDILEKEPIKLGVKEVCIIVAVIVILILVFQSSSIREIISDDDYDYEDDGTYYDEEYQKQYSELSGRLENFDVDIFRMEGDETGIVVKNTSNLPFSNLDLNIIFYDGDKKPISVKTEYIDCILPEGKWVGSLYEAPVGYETYDYLVTADNYELKEIVQLYNLVSISQLFESDANMAVRFENKSKEKISAKATAIYYDKAGNICDIESFHVFDLRPNKTEDVSSYKYLDFQKTENSGVEIILTGAYKE